MHNIDAFFAPRSIAVVGASSDPAKGGHRLLKNVLKTFRGPVYAINRKGEAVLGLPAYRSLLDIPAAAVDLVLPFVPARETVQVAREAAQKGCRGFLIQATGFADYAAFVDPDQVGRRLQDEIVAIARSTPQGMRVWGPNSGGLIKANPPLTATFILDIDPLPYQRGAAFIGHSGLFAGATFLEMLNRGEPAIASSSSIGNRADVNECDILEYLADDPITDCMTLYLESFRDGRRLVRALRRVCQAKPVVALCPGRSPETARAAATHTGSLLPSDRVKDALFRQFGVVRVGDLTEFVEFTRGFNLLRPAPMRGNRVAILTHSGAAGVSATDLLGLHGLELAELAPATKAQMHAIMPAAEAPGNPTDIWTTIEQVGIDRTHQVMLEAVLADPGVDAVLLLPLVFDMFRDHDFAACRAIIARHRKPVACWFSGDLPSLAHWRREYEKDGGVAGFDSVTMAVRMLQAQQQFHRYGERAPDVLAAAARPQPVPAAARGVLDRVRAAGRTALSEVEAKAVLGAFGIPVPVEVLAISADAAVAAAAQIGYPVVLKIVSPDIGHKTEAGGVRVGIRDATELRQAYDDMWQRASAACPAARLDGILVAEMISGGIETIAGSKDDADFGPTVMFGLGGIFVEVLADIALRVAPLARVDAALMLAEIRGSQILHGRRGRPPGDVPALIDALLRVSDLATALAGELQELDINPLAVQPAGQGVRALDAHMVLKPAEFQSVAPSHQVVG